MDTTLIALIEAERKKQIELGFDAQHDDTHSDGSLIGAAVAYAVSSFNLDLANNLWPYEGEINYHPPQDGIVKAIAVLVAEYERIERLPNAPH